MGPGTSGSGTWSGRSGSGLSLDGTGSSGGSRSGTFSSTAITGIAGSLLLGYSRLPAFARRQARVRAGLTAGRQAPRPRDAIRALSGIHGPSFHRVAFAPCLGRLRRCRWATSLDRLLMGDADYIHVEAQEEAGRWAPAREPRD